MTLSRMAALLLLASAPALAQPEPTGAQRAMGTYRRTFVPVSEIDCPKGGPGEIVVCGRSGDQYRPPIPYEPEPGAPTRMAGEAPRPDAGRGGRYCFERCPGMVGIDLGMAKKIVSGVKGLFDDDE